MKGLLLLVAGALLVSHTAGADGLDGEKTVFFGNAAGDHVAIGRVIFTPLAEGRWTIKFTLDPSRFQEYFLAMRPFHCMQTPRRSLCHFPYGKRDEVSSGDWSALEYQLLFIHKPLQSVSLDSRNGMLWKLHREGNRLVGKLYDADLDPIVAPSGNRDNPLTAEFLEPADSGSHPLPDLTIE
jgi:hypothetical protein